MYTDHYIDLIIGLQQQLQNVLQAKWNLQKVLIEAASHRLSLSQSLPNGTFRFEIII